MSDSPHEVQLALAEFDRSQLPESQRDLQGDAFRSAVQDHLSAEFLGEGGAAEVVVTQDRIIIRWSASSEAKPLTERGIDFLKEGDYEKGIATLRLALQRDPEDAAALFNLGMALSDQGAMDEAVVFLKRCLAAQPGHAHGWVALGVAQARVGDDGAAIDSLTKAVDLNPKDGHTHKNLGALLSRVGKAAEALKHLRLATQLLPSDPQTWYNLAGTLEEAGQLDEADEAYQRVIQLDPTGGLAHRARAGRSRIVEINFRERGGNLRPDALSYCLGALQRFEGMPKSTPLGKTHDISVIRALGIQHPQ